MESSGRIIMLRHVQSKWRSLPVARDMFSQIVDENCKQTRRKTPPYNCSPLIKMRILTSPLYLEICTPIWYDLYRFFTAFVIKYINEAIKLIYKMENCRIRDDFKRNTYKHTEKTTRTNVRVPRRRHVRRRTRTHRQTCTDTHALQWQIHHTHAQIETNTQRQWYRYADRLRPSTSCTVRLRWDINWHASWRQLTSYHDMMQRNGEMKMWRCGCRGCDGRFYHASAPPRRASVSSSSSSSASSSLDQTQQQLR